MSAEIARKIWDASNTMANESAVQLARQARWKVFSAADDQIDIIVSTDVAHVGYIGGYRSILLDMGRTYQTAIIATRERTLYVTSSSDAPAALEVLQDPSSIFRYGAFFVSSCPPGANCDAMPAPAASFFEAIDAALRSVLTKSAIVGVDAYEEWNRARLVNLLNSNKTVDVRAAFLKARRIKLPSEIERLRIASHLASAAIEASMQQAGVGASELEIAAQISAAIIRGGGIPRFVVVTSGLRSALVDACATEKKLASGELVRLDIGLSYQGYWADMARTYVVGEPSHLQMDRYRAILDGEDVLLSRARAGLPVVELFAQAITAVRRHPTMLQYQRTNCGHGIGIAAHEYPTIAPADDSVVLCPGMVVCVETPFYEIGWGGMMVEDTLVIGDQKNEMLTHASRELISI